MLSPPPLLPPPPSLPPPLFPLEDNSIADGGDRHYSYNPSILIIAAIVVAAIIAAASIHLLLRVLSRSRTSPFVHHLPSSSSSSSTLSSPSSAPMLSSPSDQDPKAVIDSLPLFSLSSSTAKPSSSLDCAVCLSPFQLSDELRLLPSCHHAFHAQCIDTWLKSNLSCPLCRSPISPIPAAPPPPPPPAVEPQRSESFRIDIGSVSRRTDDSSDAAPQARSYSIGSSFEYVVEEEIEAVLARVRRRPAVEKSDHEQAPPPPGEELAEIAGESHRSWLKEYVDRLASSASSSFSSLRFSQRGSHRFDPSSSGGGGFAGGESWDLERNLHLHLEEEDGGFSAFYRWLVGA